MAIPMNERKFTFTSAALPPDTFGVVSFQGRESLASPYRFEITLIAENVNIDPSDIVGAGAELSILASEGTNSYGGIVLSLEELHEIDGFAFYRAVLTPKLQLFAYVRHNRIFLAKTIPQILEEVLTSGNLTTLDFEFRLKNAYPQREYVCQYGESDLDFFTHRLEAEGLYYFFEQSKGREKIIITDSSLAHNKFGAGNFAYNPASGLNESEKEKSFFVFTGRQTMMPAKITLKDYNYRRPSLELEASAVVSPKGLGEVYLYGEHFETPETGSSLAAVRAEEFLCRERIFHGNSESPLLRSGFFYSLNGHFRDNFNTDYLTVEIDHEGNQTAFMITVTGKNIFQDENADYYRCTFVSIPMAVQFRPERKTRKSRFYGTMNAVIDAEGSGQYAELDDQGRYKVRLPFDLSGAPDGKASAWIRKAEPYAGDGHGMHFPLHKGTEVILTFIDGDPDRPIIAAAVPNPQTASPVVAQNETMAVIQTGGNNKMAFEDKAGSERILLQSPHANTWLRMGAPNDPPASAGDAAGDSGDSGDDKSGFRIHTEDKYEACIGSDYSQQILGNKIEVLIGAEEGITVGASTDIVLGVETKMTGGIATEITAGQILDVQIGPKYEYNDDSTTTMSPKAELVGGTSVGIKAGGTLPSPAKIITGALSAASALSGTAALTGNNDQTGYIVNGIVTGVSAALTTWMHVWQAQAEAPTFKSSIEMNAAKMELEAPTFELIAETKAGIMLPDTKKTTMKAEFEPTKAEINTDTIELKASAEVDIALPPTGTATTEAKFKPDSVEITSKKVDINSTAGSITLKGGTITITGTNNVKIG